MVNTKNNLSVVYMTNGGSVVQNSYSRVIVNIIVVLGQPFWFTQWPFLYCDEAHAASACACIYAESEITSLILQVQLSIVHSLYYQRWKAGREPGNKTIY